MNSVLQMTFDITIGILKEYSFLFWMLLALGVGIARSAHMDYLKIARSFGEQKLQGLEEKAFACWKVYGFYTKFIKVRRFYEIYDNLCVILASLALLRGDEKEFLSKVNSTKRAQIGKVFMLALYYRSRDKIDVAEKYYKEYSELKHDDKTIEMIMDKLFRINNLRIVDEHLSEVIKKYKNPAIIKLLKDNGIMVYEK